MGKITSYKDFKNNVQSIRDELTKQGYTPRSVPSEQKEETKNTKKIEKGKGLFKETGKSSFNDIPKIQELQNEYQKAKDWGFYDYTIDQIKKEELPTKFGNVNMNKRPLIRWNDELKKKYENELKSWGYDPEIGGIDTVFGGSDKFGTDINNSGWNVAYTPIMPDGTFLDKGTVDNYMNSLVKEAYEKNGNVTNEELETLDKKGMQVGDKYVHGIFAGVDGDEKDYHKPYSAEDRGKLMHFSGKYGAINIAKRGTDNLKTNPNEEQSDSDEKEEYLNKQVDIPITDNKSISLKYRTVKTIDNFLKRNKEKNKYKKAQQLDEMIDKLDLSENELKNAKSYAGLKKLSLMSSSNGKDSVLKELGQFVAYPIGEMYDFAKRAERTYVKDGFPFKVQQMGAGDYSEQLQELDKYYSENPDELGNDFFNRKSTGNDAYSDYMDNLRKVKAYEAFDNTNPVTHFIAEKGFGSMGQMLAAYGTAGLMGLPDVTEGVSSAAKKVAGGTKIGQVVSKVANATPDIANVAEKGIGSKIANAVINKANTLSIGSAAKFLNPLDNSTTLLMGIDSAQQKYDDLVKNGYDKDTAYKNAMFTGYVNTITEKMGYDGTPESMMFALSPTGSTKKNVGKVLKQYMKANVGEGLEEVYATLFERMGDVVSKVGYVDENGKIQQRKLVGKEGVIDLPALGESFLGGAVGGAVMGGAGVVDTILHTDAKSVRECGDKVRQALSKANKEVSQKVHEAGVEMPELPKQIDWKKSTVPEMKEYFNKVVKVYRDILSDEKVINYDRKVAENTLNKMNTAETGNEVNEATNINNVNATPQTENSIQNVPKTSEIEPLQAVQETAPLNAQVNDISNINTQNSKINADNSTINDTTSEINSVDTLNAIDTLPNISTQENGVQSSVNRVTDEVHNAMNKVGLNVSESATGIQEANTRFMSSNDNLFDKNYVSNYANDFVQAMSEKSGRSYTALSQETDNLADELVNKTLTGNSVLDGNREFQTVVRNFKDVLREGIKKNANLHNNVYGANEVLNAQVQDIENGDYSSLNITENPNNNVTFAPITENEQNIGYVIERDNGYSNELSESDFTVKQKNGEYGTRNGITYGHFGTHQNSNGNNIVSYLPTGNAVAILPNQNSAIEFMKQAENETSGYSIYLYDDNGVTKTGGDMSQFINVLNNAKNAVQVEQNSGNVGIQSNTGVSNNVESEKINSQAPNTDENTNTTQTDNAIKSIEISEEDKIPGLLQDEYSDLLSLEDRTALDTLGSAIGVPIKIVPTISNDANGCYYKGVIYISLSADDKVMTVFSHELTHYLEDTLDYTEYKKCVLDFIQKNTDKSIDELVKEKVDTYAKSSIYLTYEEATREIVADYTQNILKDADAVMEFVDSIENKEQRRGVIRRLLDAIKELINKIKAKFSSKHSQMQDLQKTHDLLENMLKEAAENTESDTGSETRYSFGGEKAKTADIGLLQKAETLEKDGASAEKIRKVTGWSRGLDNKWKFEIDDSKAKYKEEKIRLGKAVNLNEVLEHEDLFKAYPDLKKVKVKEISDLDARGVYSPNFDCIFINENLPTQEKLKSLIHEVQHAIQVREGFAVGESPDNENRKRSAGEIEADDVKSRQSMSKEERLNTFPESMKPNQNADVVFWENGKGTNKTKFSLKGNSDNENSNIGEKDVEAIQSIARKSIYDFSDEDMKKTKKIAERYYSEMKEKSPFFRAWFGDWRANDKTPVHVVTEKDNSRGVRKNIDTGWDINVSGKVFNETKGHKGPKNVSAVSHLDYINSIVESAILFDSYTIPNTNAKSNNSMMMHSLYAISNIGNENELVKLYVEELNNINSNGTIKRAYQLQNINKIPLESKRFSNNSLASSDQRNNYTISELHALVKQHDKNFKPTEASKVVNEDGTPKVVYHGTTSNFTTFDTQRFNTRENSGDYVGEGFFFTDKESTAKKYGSNVMPVYLNLRNPLIINTENDGKKFRSTFLNMYQKGNKELRDLIGGDYDYFSIMKENPSAIRQELQRRGYDGLIDNLYGQYAVFNSEQIKSATDNIGTFDKNNADIKYSMKKSTDEKIENRLSGDDLLNAYDTIEEIRNVGGKVDENGYAYVYHNTSKDNAENIRKTGVMSAKEDGIFVSTKPDGQSAGYGNETVSLKIPVEKLVLDDMFDDELHFRIPLKNKNDTLNVSNYLIDKSNTDNAQIKSIAKNTLNKDNVEYAYRYSDMNNEQKEAYNRAKKGDVNSAYDLIEQFVYQSGIMKNLSNDVYLLPVVGEEGTSDNVLPTCIANFISTQKGNQVFSGIAKQEGSNSRKLSIWERMKENYPEFDISSDISYNDIKGKSFLLIDDNSTTGRTFKGLEGFIEDNGGKVVGYYAMTTGQDMSEKMIATDETWEKLKQFGIEKIRNFAESEGIRREISRNGLTERETRELIRQYKKKVDKRRTNSFMPKSGETRTEIQRIYDDENGTKRTGRGKARGKFSLKSSNSSSLDTVENNTDNVQIKSDNFKNWFGDWENNPSKASKVVNEDGTPKAVYHGTSNGGFWFFDTYGSNFGLFGNGSYFTESKNVADSYTNKGKGNNKQVYEVYLNIRNPIDMDAKADISKWNKAFEKQDIDVVAREGDSNEQVYKKLIEELEYNDYSKYEAEEIVSDIFRYDMGYDGITHIGGGRFYDGSERHRVWIAFDPEQVKSATDNVGTFDKNNADIRYLSQKSKATTVHSVSKKLISDYGVESKVKPSDISEAIADITSKINDTYYGEGDINKKYAKLEKVAYGVAENIVDQMKKKDNYAEETYNNLRKEIKSTKIRISEADKGDFTEWNDFRKQNFGYLTISNKEGIPVDSYYKELAQEYPGMFDESTHMAVGDQLRNIVDTLRDLKPKEYDLSTEERNEMLEEVANEVILRSINLADDMGYIDKNGNADKIYTENDMRGALDKQKERLNNKHEKQLDRQKERLENKYEKRLETQKTKYIEQREKIRKQLIDKVNQQKEKAKARKKESEDRTKLLKLAREINSMKLSPQDKNKLPDILKEIDTVSKGILKKGYTTKDGKAVMGELDLKQLKEDYELLKQDENFLPDKDVELKISRLDKMQIADMNINDVRDLIQTLQEVKHEIRTKDKMINDVRNSEIAHIAVECIKEIQHSKGIEDDRKGARYRGYISTHLTPERMFRRLSGYAKNGVFEGLAKDLSDGQRKSMTFKQRASEKFGKFTEKETEKMSKFTGKKAELIDISKYDTQGRKVYITPDMRVSLYLHSKNYSNLKHIQYGGITIPNWNLYKQGKIKEAYESAGITIRLTPSQVNEITKQMTPFEKSFADVAYNFFNVDCTKAINETSLALKGYEIATVKDYFPIVSDENFVNKDFETLVKNGTLEAKGMLKERKNAANPVRLESVIRVINRHMENVGDYYGLAIPIRNFNKVYNSMGKNYNYSVKQSLKQKWGSKADDYIKHLITDLQGGRKTDITLFDILKGNYAQAVLTLNAGVVFQQTASYPLAAAIVGYKALAKAFTERVTKADIEIINKHTPLLWYRSQGYTTTELGDYANGNFEDWTKKGKMPWLMGAIQAMDILTTTKLWKAAEFYVRDNYKALERGTDEYYDKVADVYNAIIENTQPNYSIMQRPDVLRNPNALIKALTMFKTVTLQCFNLVYDAYGEYRARYREYQANKTNENAENLKSSSRKLGTTISALIVSILTLGVFKGVGRYTKGKFQDYYGDADNDNEITFKSLMSAYGVDIFNGIAGNAIGGSEFASLAEYILSIFDIGNAVWYDVQAPALDTVNGVVGGITKLLLTIEKNGLSNPRAYAKAVIKLLETLGNATGVPVKNAKDLIYGISKDITDVTHTKNIFDILE